MNCGKPSLGAKIPKQHKAKTREPITLSEPSAECVAAQNRIKLEKQMQKQKQCTDEISVICELPPDIDDSETTPDVKIEVKTEIKQEDEQRNTRHKYKGKELD